MLGRAGTLELKVNREAVTLVAPSSEFFKRHYSSPPLYLITSPCLRYTLETTMRQLLPTQLLRHNGLRKYPHPLLRTHGNQPVGRGAGLFV